MPLRRHLRSCHGCPVVTRVLCHILPLVAIVGLFAMTYALLPETWQGVGVGPRVALGQVPCPETLANPVDFLKGVGMEFQSYVEIGMFGKYM